jgi:PAS domain S-box-containing protein
MTLAPMSLVWLVDIIGSSLMIVLSLYAVKLIRDIYTKKRDIPLYTYLYAQTIALVIFAFSRAGGHIVKRILITADQPDIWYILSPISGSINSITFVIFGLTALFYSNVKAISERIDVLEKTKRDLKDSEEKYRTLIEDISDIIYSLNDRGEFISINTTGLNLLGYPKEEIIGSHFSKVVFKEDFDKAVKLFKEFLEHKKEIHSGLELRLQTKKGNVIYTELNARARRDEDGRLLRIEGCVRNITERKEADEKIKNRMEDLRIINNIIKDVSSTLDLEEVLHRITKSAAELINGDGASIAILDEEKGVITYPHHYRMPEKLKKVVARKGEGLASQVIETKKSIILNDYPSHPRALKEFVDAGLKVLIAVPLISKGKAFGTLGVFGLKEESEFSEHDMELLEGVGKEAAVAIENARLYQEIKEFREILEQKVKERTRELEEKTIEIEQANIKLKELDRLKSMFIASMSHELRTPLNSIIGFTGVILQGLAGELNAEQRDHLRRVASSARHLLALINDVIDISKIEAGKIESYTEEFQLDEVIKEAVSNLKTQIDNKGLALEISIPQALKLKTDRRRFLQCILNYLTNAIKFTQRGKISIVANEIDGMVEIKVKDTGIGIKEKDIPKLFNSFTRLDSPLMPTTSGTGLGLYLTKKLATEVLGGSVSVESRYEKGSTFILKIPKELPNLK